MQTADQYRAAQIANGDICQRCLTYRLFGSPKGPWTCHQCLAIERTNSLYHDKFIRCPHCGETEKPDDWDFETLPEWRSDEDRHTRTCNRCEQDFQFQTVVSYSFVSPAMDGHKDEPSDIPF